MVEHGVAPGARVVGFAFDGTGYGNDGAIWGGEVFLAGYDKVERLAHLRYLALPGGDATIRKPYRAALAHLWAAGVPWAPDLAPAAMATDEERAVIERQLERDVQCVRSSSMGRLFDAVSSLLGLRHVVSYEAQAAIELETIAAGHLGVARPYRFDVGDDEIDPRPVLRAIVADLRDGWPVVAAAAGFHVAVARLIGDLAAKLCRQAGIEQVALSGGVFQNVLLVGLARAELTGRGLGVLTHRLVPPNDGGLALGQVAVAAYGAAKED
jgi:hydrogenase maturation protein HypF